MIIIYDNILVLY